VKALPDRLASSLEQVLGEKPTYSPAAKSCSGMLKDEVDLELWNKLTHPQLVELYQKFMSWEPKPELTSYHISFIKNYLSLLVYFQEHLTCQVPERVNKTLFHWICNQKSYLQLYQERKKDGGKFHIDDHHVKYLTEIGLGKKAKKN
jgi:hypothetical protein